MQGQRLPFLGSEESSALIMNLLPRRRLLHSSGPLLVSLLALFQTTGCGPQAPGALTGGTGGDASGEQPGAGGSAGGVLGSGGVSTGGLGSGGETAGSGGDVGAGGAATGGNAAGGVSGSGGEPGAGGTGAGGDAGSGGGPGTGGQSGEVCPLPATYAWT